MSSIGPELKRLRLENDMTQQDAADRLCITRQAVSNYENGKTEPDLDMLSRLAALYGTDAGAILSGKAPEAPPEKKVRKKILPIAAAAGAILLAGISILFLRSKPEAPPAPPAEPAEVLVAADPDAPPPPPAEPAEVLIAAEPDDIPEAAVLVDGRSDCAVYYWEDGENVTLAVCADGRILQSLDAGKPQSILWGQTVCLTDYDCWYAGTSGLYHLDGQTLTCVSRRPVKALCFIPVVEDLCFIGETPVILTWAPEQEDATWMAADEIVSLSPDGTEQVLLFDARKKWSLPIAEVYFASDGRVGFVTRSDVGMGQEDEINYVLYSALYGVPVSDTPQIRAVWYKAGHPDTMPGFTWENPLGWFDAALQKENERLSALGIGFDG